MQAKNITYEHEGKTLEGFYAYDPNWREKRPGVILCHAWRGRDQFVCTKAMEMANWGYATFALDLYGKGVLGKNTEENQALMAPFMKDRFFLQRRLLASLETFKQQPMVDPSKIAAIGFCFGGLCALDFARSEADLTGVVSVHGLLMGRENDKPKTIKSKVLALHGHEDPLVPPEQVAGFEKEMTADHADWQIHIYGNTKHAFTNPEAHDANMGLVYNERAERRAWPAIRLFLTECFS